MTLPPNLVKLLFWMDRPAESVLEALPLVGLLQVDDQKLQKPYRSFQRLGALNGPNFTVNKVQILRSTPTGARNRHRQGLAALGGGADGGFH